MNFKHYNITFNLNDSFIIPSPKFGEQNIILKNSDYKESNRFSGTYKLNYSYINGPIEKTNFVYDIS